MEVARGSNCSVTSEANPNLKPGNTEALISVMLSPLRADVISAPDVSLCRCTLQRPRCPGKAALFVAVAGWAGRGSAPQGQGRRAPAGVSVTRAGPGGAHPAPAAPPAQPSSGRRDRCSRPANTRPFRAGSPGLRSAGPRGALPARPRPGAAPAGPRIAGAAPAAHPGPVRRARGRGNPPPPPPSPEPPPGAPAHRSRRRPPERPRRRLCPE